VSESTRRIPDDSAKRASSYSASVEGNVIVALPFGEMFLCQPSPDFERAAKTW